MDSNSGQKCSLDIHTPESRLLLHLYERIISGDLITFEALKQYLSKFPDSAKLRKCLFRSFALQRKLHWGFFKDLSPKTHRKLWHEIVMADSQFRFGGNLKRFMSIPDIYLGLCDIHGYTKYCHDKKRNMSMIDLLDRMIYEDVNAICAEFGVISKRAQGDEILILGASPQDVIKAVLQIMDYFNTQGRSFRNTVLSKRLPGTVLPKFQISAGIAGGQKFTPLIITRDGDVSGDIVNTAARLQAKANKISPDKNRIMLTNHVYQKFLAAQKTDRDEYFSRIDFFNIGPVEFKGVNLTVYDVIFLPDEVCRLELREVTDELLQSLNKKLWKARIYETALDAAARAVKVLHECGASETADNLTELLKSAWKTYYAEYFEASIRIFAQVVDEMAAVKDVDRIVLEHLQLVKCGYLEVCDQYVRMLDEEVELRINDLFDPESKARYIMLSKHRNSADKARSSARLKLSNRKKLWLRTADEISEQLGITLRSLK